MANVAVTAKTTGKLRTRTSLVTVILLILVIMAVGFFFFNIYQCLVNLSFLHVIRAIGFLVGIVLAVMYILITSSITFATVLATDKRYLIMKCWDNGLVPYSIESKIPFFGEFIPAKTDIVKVPVNEIRSISIGTRNYIKRISLCSDFTDMLDKIETKSKQGKRTISKVDILYVETLKDECAFMSIKGYSVKDVCKVIQSVRRVNPNILVQSGSRQYRKLVTE